MGCRVPPRPADEARCSAPGIRGLAGLTEELDRLGPPSTGGLDQIEHAGHPVREQNVFDEAASDVHSNTLNPALSGGS